MGSSIRLFTVRGIAVRMHLTFPLILVWSAVQFGLLADQGFSGAVFGVLVTLLLFVIVVLHEFGHSFAAQYYGVTVKEIVLLPIGGVAQLAHIPEKPIQEFVIAVAGPLVNFVLAGLMLAVAALFGQDLFVADLGGMIAGMTGLSLPAIFSYLFSANLFIAVFNLIPAFPMDGGRILRALLASRMDYGRATAIAAAIGQGLAWLMGLWGFLGGGFFIILVAFFIYIGAGQERQQVLLRRSLSGLTVAQAYSRQAQKLAADATVQDAVNLTLRSFQADFPVCTGDQLVGLLTYTRLLEALDRHGPSTPISEVMTTGVTPISPRDSLLDAQQKLSENKLDALPVVENGLVLGLLTSRDIGELYRLVTRSPELFSPETAG
jgi:stage IV sporulation protein FB